MKQISDFFNKVATDAVTVRAATNAVVNAATTSTVSAAANAVTNPLVEEVVHEIKTGQVYSTWSLFGLRQLAQSYPIITETLLGVGVLIAVGTIVYHIHGVRKHAVVTVDDKKTVGYVDSQTGEKLDVEKVQFDPETLKPMNVERNGVGVELKPLDKEDVTAISNSPIYPVAIVKTSPVHPAIATTSISPIDSPFRRLRKSRRTHGKRENGKSRSSRTRRRSRSKSHSRSRSKNRRSRSRSLGRK